MRKKKALTAAEKITRKNWDMKYVGVEERWKASELLRSCFPYDSLEGMFLTNLSIGFGRELEIISLKQGRS